MTPTSFRSPQPDAPIGVFDSGIGGLSVLQALRTALPAEDFVYLADSAHTPYGERSTEFIAQRTIAIGEHLRQTYGVKLLVVACNSATAAGVQALRKAHPGWPVVALEPALKPAAQRTQTAHVGVLATRATLSSAKYAALKQTVARDMPHISSTEVACDGLAAAIEAAALSDNETVVATLLDAYLAALGPLGPDAGATDTVVLGCTHYPLVRHLIEERVGPGVTLIDAGVPVARQAARLLYATGLLRDSGDSRQDTSAPSGSLNLLASGEVVTLQAAAQRWLDLASVTINRAC
ncbi:glutamate racemase [Ottowia sp.]|uniref:glutamate racemase n=1 Tax=Ottowia sp. TaxID=1898956 RepID=UPI003A898B8B